MAKKLRKAKPLLPGKPLTPRTLSRSASLPAERLNPAFSNRAGFEELIATSTARILPTDEQLDVVISLARRLPELADLVDELEVVKRDFRSSFNFWKGSGIFTLIMNTWFDLRTLITQRAVGYFSREMRSADRVVTDIFKRFYNSPLLDPRSRRYSNDARPIVFVGPTGPDEYYTYPPRMSEFQNRPLGIINLPEGSVNNCWGWLALAHETGHDIYASILGLSEELEAAIADQMRSQATSGAFTLNDVNFIDGDVQLQMSGGELAGFLWKAWVNEAQADIVGLLNCGPAALMTLQPIIGFDATDAMEEDIFADDGELKIRPEPHPTPYLRNVLNIQALRILGLTEQADALQARFDALKPVVSSISWTFRSQSGPVVTTQPVTELETTAAIAAEFLLNHPLAALNGRSFREVISFSTSDQRLAEEAATKLLAGDPFFSRAIPPRVALAATVIALESDLSKADLIHDTFVHYLSE